MTPIPRAIAPLVTTISSIAGMVTLAQLLADALQHVASNLAAVVGDDARSEFDDEVLTVV